MYTQETEKMEETDASWIFDSLLCFLQGPVWNAPLQSFIEEKSLIFEPDTKNDNADYPGIFNDFRNLVDLMLSCYMEDIGITPQQFEEACNKGKQLVLTSEFDQNLFELIWAANDYAMFKRIMAQRNVELQLEALELIEQKYGITPPSFVPKKNKGAPIGPDALKKLKQTPEIERQIREEINKKFSKEPECVDAEKERQYIDEEKKLLEKKLNKTAASSDQEQTAGGGGSENKDDGYFKTAATGTEIDKMELQKRREYLRAQRDKLVALKKEARKKQLEASNAGAVTERARPKSAKAAEAVLAGNAGGADPKQQQQLQIRIALAERLRSEVMNSKDSN